MSFPSSFDEQEHTVLAWLREEKAREPTKLSLWTARPLVPGEPVYRPGWEHVRTLWHMAREQRLRVWKAMGRYDVPLEELELGSAGYSMVDDELKEMMELVGASSPPCLHCLRVLHLSSMNRLTDVSLQSLAQAGCGKNLTSLTLRDLDEWVTDASVQALAEAGCGKNLMSLHLEDGKSIDLKEGVTDASLRALVEAGCGESLRVLFLGDLTEGVTDAGFHALAQAGCGKNLTSLKLWWLSDAVTDVAIRLLAQVGCGANLSDVFIRYNQRLSDSFAAPLGLPRDLDGEQPAKIHRLWQLRRDQFLFLQQNAQQLGSAARAVSLWDEQHEDPEDKLGPVVFTWSPRNAQKRHLLGMLPEEVWQVVLGFCPSEEYDRTARNPSSREFYFLLKQSLLELEFGRMLPSPALGGLWMASRDRMATHARVLYLESQCLQPPTAAVVECVAEIVPLPFVRELRVPSQIKIDVEALHGAVAPFVRAPHKLKITECQ